MAEPNPSGRSPARGRFLMPAAWMLVANSFLFEMLTPRRASDPVPISELITAGISRLSLLAAFVLCFAWAVQSATGRWFRFAFSLRTIFVAVTVTACALWLGSEVRIVQERKAVLAECRRFDESFDRWYRPQSGYGRISLVRRLLGDEPRYFMHLPRMVGQEWFARAEVAFPEAQLRVNGKLVNEEPGEEFRDSLYDPDRRPNQGTLFKTGLIDPNAADQNSPQSTPPASNYPVRD